MRKEHGGLGVRQLKEFNEALLGKWRWRLLVDRVGLWYRVLVARYGEEDGGRSWSVWWKEVVRIRDGVGGGAVGWFEGSVVWRLGNGAYTSFLRDRWCSDVPFCIRFSQLFDLALDKSILVRDKYLLGWEVGGEAWKWPA